MNKNNMIKSAILISIMVSTISTTYAYSVLMGPQPPYYRQCYQSVDGKDFIGDALTLMDLLKLTHNRDMKAPIMQQDIDNASAKISVYNSAAANQIKSMNDNYAIKAEEIARMKKEAFKKEMDYIKHLSEASINQELYGFFNDNNGQHGIIDRDTQSYKYFQELCKRNKMFKSVSGTGQVADSARTVNNNSISAMNRFTSFSSSLQISNSLIETHYTKYCNAQDIQAGVCENPSLRLCEEGNVNAGVCEGEEEFKLADAEINSVNFLNPTGNKETNSIPEELFQTKYTYDEAEAEAAKVFAENVVFSNFIPSPSLQEKTESRKLSFISAYNSNMAMLNLANHSFLVAHQRRVPVTHFKNEAVTGETITNESNTSSSPNSSSSASSSGSQDSTDASNIVSKFSTNPVPGSRMSSPFNPNRMHPVHNRVMPHNGIDFAAPTGTPIRVTNDGVVTFVGNRGGYGQTVIVDHGGGVTTLYAHMSAYESGITRGKVVSRNDVLGKVGMTGTATGPHLHYEIRINGTPVDPITGKRSGTGSIASDGTGNSFNNPQHAYDIQMSEIDILRYMIHNFKGPDNNAAIMAAKQKGIDVVKYSLITMRNKLMVDEIQQNERIESLLAAILVQMANSPDNLEYLREIR